MKHSWLSTRVRHARTAPSRGASAVEWVIITAIIAGVALGLAATISSVVKTKQNELVTNVNDK
jgi:Flp pilus assembly pilin Flp